MKSLKKEYEARLVTIKKSVENQGLGRMEYSINEKNIPKYPKDPTTHADEEIGRLYAEFTQWQSYSKQKLALIEAEIMILKSMIRKALAVDAQEFAASGMSVTAAKKAAQDSGSLTMEFVEDLENKSAEKALLEGAYEHYESCVKALSREISRRKMDRDRDGEYLTGDKIKAAAKKK